MSNWNDPPSTVLKSWQYTSIRYQSDSISQPSAKWWNQKVFDKFCPYSGSLSANMKPEKNSLLKSCSSEQVKDLLSYR